MAGVRRIYPPEALGLGLGLRTVVTAWSGALVATTRLAGQTLGATLAAALLPLGLRADNAAAPAALSLASRLARLDPAYRLPPRKEMAEITD